MMVPSRSMTRCAQAPLAAGVFQKSMLEAPVAPAVKWITRQRRMVIGRPPAMSRRRTPSSQSLPICMTSAFFYPGGGQRRNAKQGKGEKKQGFHCLLGLFGKAGARGEFYSAANAAAAGVLILQAVAPVVAVERRAGRGGKADAGGNQQQESAIGRAIIDYGRCGKGAVARDLPILGVRKSKKAGNQRASGSDFFCQCGIEEGFQQLGKLREERGQKGQRAEGGGAPVGHARGAVSKVGGRPHTA